MIAIWFFQSNIHALPYAKSRFKIQKHSHHTDRKKYTVQQGNKTREPKKRREKKMSDAGIEPAIFCEQDRKQTPYH
jgi:hypothetical protein